MRKRLTCFLLTLCLLLTGCGKTPQTDSAEDTDIPETEKNDHFSGSRGSSRLIGFHGVDKEAAQLAESLVERYYRSVGNLALQDCSDLFTTQTEADLHSAIWHTLIEIRKASLIDLRLKSYRFTLTLEDSWYDSNGVLYLTVTEDADMHFMATPRTKSQQFDTIHDFALAQDPDGVWKIVSHNSDDNPYYNFLYSEAMGSDARLEDFLRDIAQRQQTLDNTDDISQLQWDHDYDRKAAYQYMQRWIKRRNSDWDAYDTVGGNCQNFGSQVLHAGGIPMDEEGDAQWFWYTHDEQDFSWINVGYFMDYAKANEGYGLVSLPEAAYYTGDVGDILIFGDDGLNHTTVIADLITDKAGQTVDYLICSNTSNYRNFPASAYYYTRQWLVRILGWNE